jgi:hypothetical protein
MVSLPVTRIKVSPLAGKMRRDIPSNSAQNTTRYFMALFLELGIFLLIVLIPDCGNEASSGSQKRYSVFRALLLSAAQFDRF